nr:MAG TPA: hypothetical protein [Bacteriophage sp.]
MVDSGSGSPAGSVLVSGSAGVVGSVVDSVAVCSACSVSVGFSTCAV